MRGKNLEQIPHREVQEIIQEARETIEKLDSKMECSIGGKGTVDGSTRQLEVEIRTTDARELQRLLAEGEDLGLIAVGFIASSAGHDDVTVKFGKEL